MEISDFDYYLPQELIASIPFEPRDACKLMCLDRADGTINHKHFYDLAGFLKKGDVLVFNDSKVIPARILFKHANKNCEIFLTTKVGADEWLAIGKPGKVLQPGNEFKLSDNLSATVVEILPDGQRLIRFSLAGEMLDKALIKIGLPPFPPYIKNTKAKMEDYQTIYAANDGSVAAPTAGLHFTDSLFSKLKAQGVQLEFVTLHVGLGTFLPVKSQKVEDHLMHKEVYSLDQQVAERLNKAKAEGRRLIAVGTTAVRVLESSFTENGFRAGMGETDIYIYPGYKWKCVDAMITNFHLPKSTLLLLVASFAGKEFMEKAYQEAIKQHYRFYSFGDAMFIE